MDAFSAERERKTAKPQGLGSVQHLRAVISRWTWKGTPCSQSLHVDTLGARAFPVFAPQGRQPQPAVRPLQREQHRAVPTLFRLKHPFCARNTTCSVFACVQLLRGLEVLKEFLFFFFFCGKCGKEHINHNLIQMSMPGFLFLLPVTCSSEKCPCLVLSLSLPMAETWK